MKYQSTPYRARNSRHAAVRILPLALLVASGCMAGKLTQVAAPEGGAVLVNDVQSDVSMATSTHIPKATVCVSQAAAPRGVRRLTLVELNNTIKDLFGDPNAPQATSLFAGDARTYGFDNIQTSLGVRDNQAMSVSSFAETVGTYAGGKAATLSSCQTNDTTCRQNFIQSFGKKAFRMPLTPAQVQSYEAVMATGTTFSEGVSFVVNAMVQSPYFLYRFELGSEDPKVPGQYLLSQYEIASELSYMLTGSMPDEALLLAADNNALDANGIKAQSERLIALPKAHEAIDRFFMEWLQVDDLELQARSEGTDVLSATVKEAMKLETKAFVDDTVFAQNGSYVDLMTRDVTFTNDVLSKFYGGAAPAASTNASSVFGMAATTPSSMGRVGGVLGHGGVLTAASQPTYASPTLRGRMLRMRLLCGSVSAPPPGTPPLPAASGEQTLRQRFVAHTMSGSCAPCHLQMDPLAFPLGNFDTLGRVRAGGTENGLPTDVSGTVSLKTGDRPVSGPAELFSEIAKSPEGAACLARHWTMYAMGRLTWPEDTCTFEKVAQGAAASSNNLQAMLLALTQAKSFTIRTKDS